jgi:hypothetical protein
VEGSVTRVAVIPPLLFEALAMSLCQTMSVAETARLLRITVHRLWRSIDHHAPAVRRRRARPRDSGTFKVDLIAHDDQAQRIAHVSMDMSQAHIKGVTAQSPHAQISFDCCNVTAMVNDAMDKVRKLEMAEQPQVVRSALGAERKIVSVDVRNAPRRTQLDGTPARHDVSLEALPPQDCNGVAPSGRPLLPTTRSRRRRRWRVGCPGPAAADSSRSRS